MPDSIRELITELAHVGDVIRRISSGAPGRSPSQDQRAVLDDELAALGRREDEIIRVLRGHARRSETRQAMPPAGPMTA